MKKRATCVHGWGVGPAFWDRLIDALEDVEANKIDLAFTSTIEETRDNTSDPAIYITHSLGTMWALKKRQTKITALISINGFAYFNNFVPGRVLRAMKMRLQKEPYAQMKDFWQMYDLPPSDNLNLERLREGLEWLECWDARPQLKEFDGPVLALAGQNDQLLPLALMEKEWAGHDLRVCESAGHALPHSDPRWCAKQIKAFVDGL